MCKVVSKNWSTHLFNFFLQTGDGKVSIEKLTTSGASLKAVMRCVLCQAGHTWSNTDRSATFNGLLSGSILFSGAVPSRIIRLVIHYESIISTTTPK